MNGDFGKEISPQADIMRQAIEQARDDTSLMPDGELHLKVVDMVLVHKTHTYAGAGMVVHISERTAQGWCLSFIDRVAEIGGFKVCAKRHTDKVQ